MSNITNTQMPIRAIARPNNGKDVIYPINEDAGDESLLSNMEPVFKLVTIKSLIEYPVPIRWLIKGFFESGGMNVMSGAYGSGKSFIAFDIAFCVAAGIDWHGNKVIQAPVIILAGEGHSGIGNRISALEIKYGINCPECLYVSEVPAILTDIEHTKMVSNTVNQICPDAGLVIVDTLNRNFGSSDENSTSDMTTFVRNIDMSFRLSGKTVFIVHHTGHTSERGRGSSVLPGACEGEFFVKKTKDNVVLSCTKQKNNVQPDSIQFSLKPIPLPDDTDGNPVTSAVLEFNGKATINGTRQSTLDGNNKKILTALIEAIAKHGIDPPEDLRRRIGSNNLPSERLPIKVVSIKHWSDIAYQAITIDQRTDGTDVKKQTDNLNKSKAKAFKRGIDTLSKRGDADTYGDYAWSISRH
jgi:hypothetical protein